MVFKNKLGLEDSVLLAHEEERISKIKAIEIFKSEILDEFEAGSFETLAYIHSVLFGDIYDFAGKLRIENISKGGFRFVPAMYLEDAVLKISQMPQSSFDEIIEKYVEMNVAHPFREGNGRSSRLWLDHMLKTEFNLVIDWQCVDKTEYLLAMERSPIKDLEIKILIKDALTDRVLSEEVFANGIDASYEYEGYKTFKTQHLDNH